MNRNRDFSDYSSRIRQGFSFGKFWRRLTPGQIVLTGFVLIAIIGMFLLMLPVSNVHGWWTNWLDALFTSTSAVCVTGLVVLDTGTYWSLFGQIVIILLIQIGGLGFMTMMTFFFLALGKRVTFHDRLLLQSSVNSSHVQGIIQFVKYILGSAFAIEAVGGILLSTVFIPQYGWGKGIWFGFWHSISMYCNAGFDLIGGFQSFTGYVDNWTLSLTVCALIVIGGLGFSVYVDLIEYFGSKLSMKKIDDRKVYSKPVHALSVHSKIVLVTTGVLIVGGAFTFYMLERSNPAQQTRDKRPDVYRRLSRIDGRRDQDHLYRDHIYHRMVGSDGQEAGELLPQGNPVHDHPSRDVRLYHRYGRRHPDLLYRYGQQSGSQFGLSAVRSFFGIRYRRTYLRRNDSSEQRKPYGDYHRDDDRPCRTSDHRVGSDLYRKARTQKRRPVQAA